MPQIDFTSLLTDHAVTDKNEQAVWALVAALLGDALDTSGSTALQEIKDLLPD